MDKYKLKIFFICLSFLYLVSSAGQNRPSPFDERIDERRSLIYRDVAGYKGIPVNDTSVLNAMFRVPRHAFVPDELQSYAYLNRPLPIGYEQTISQPVIVASMTQYLNTAEGLKILEIGTGSGYQAAVLAEMGCNVYTLEIVPELGRRAEQTLKSLGYNNVHVKIGDGYEGWPEFAPFDRIIVTCAPEEVPDPLKEQLNTGGRIVIPVGQQDKIQYLVIFKKNMLGKLVEETKYPVRFVPMTGKAQDRN